MGLLDKLLARSAPAGAPQKRKTIVRVLLDDAGHVQDVVLKMSCGDAERDARIVEEVRATRFARGKLGSGSVRQWHEFAYSVD